MIGSVLRRCYRLLAFTGHYAVILVRANLVVAREVLSPRSRLTPGVVVLPLRSRTWPEITTIANLISLTPGTLVVGVRADPPALVVHGMHAADPDRFRAELHDLEVRMLTAAGRLAPEAGPRSCSEEGDQP